MEIILCTSLKIILYGKFIARFVGCKDYYEKFYFKKKINNFI